MCVIVRGRRAMGSVSNSNGDYDIDDELSLKERLKRAETVSPVFMLNHNYVLSLVVPLYTHTVLLC